MQTDTINTFGNLTKNPETRTGKNNKPYVILNVAFNPEDGQRTFVKCFAWSNTQMNFAKKLQKGDRVHIIGDVTEREAKNGSKLTFVKLGYFRKHVRKRPVSPKHKRKILEREETEMSIVTLEQVMNAVEADRNLGICLACGVEQDGCEPDARGYICEQCGEPKVHGAEELLMRLA